MSYLVLARKWRPRTFEEVVGQATVTRTLQNALASGRVGHAFLLSGARGVGKTTTARILARALNCVNGPTDKPCGECPSCIEIATGTSLDVQEIDGATHNGVEQVRELRESARYNPARDRYKVWIIDEVHMLSTGAFNALLKTLEEPPPRVKFIFATTEYHKLPDTILSRCQQYDFRLVPLGELAAHLRAVASGEKISVSDEALNRIARAAEGSVRDALSLFDQVLSYSGTEVKDEDIAALLGLVDRELLFETVTAFVEGNGRALLEVVDRLSAYGADYRNFARELILHLRELLVLKLAGETSPLLAQVVPEERGRMATLAGRFSEEELLRVVDLLSRAENDLRSAEDQRVTLELTFLKLAQLRRLVPFAELVRRVERLGGGVVEPAPAAAPEAPARPAPPAPPAAPRPLPPVPAAPPPPRAPEPPPRPAASVPEPAAVLVAAPASTADGPAIFASMLARARPSLAGTMKLATARLDGDTLVLQVTADLAKFATTQADDLRQLLKAADPRPLKLRVAVEVAEPPPAAAAGPAEEKRAKLMAEASQEPAVKEALDLFGGRVVDVREG